MTVFLNVEKIFGFYKTRILLSAGKLIFARNILHYEVGWLVMDCVCTILLQSLVQLPLCQTNPVSGNVHKMDAV